MTPATGVSDSHTDHASDQRLRRLALTLFDGTAELHHQHSASRRLLHIATGYYTAGRAIDAERPDRAARDLVLARPLADVTPDAQAISACVVALQRNKLRPQREPAFLRLEAKDQKIALRLAAILHVAAWLERHTTAELRAVHIHGDETTLVLDEPAGSMDQADLSDELWHETFGKISLQIDEQRSDRLTRPLDRSSEDGAEALAVIVLPNVSRDRLALLDGGDSIAEGARWVLRRFFDKLLAREDGVRKGDDDEDVHQMRVATRRLRASLQVVEPIYERKLVRRYRRGLGRIAESLGAVRDCDVFLMHVAGYCDTLPSDQRDGMQPLLDALTARHAKAREQLLADLERRGYRKFKHAFATFLTAPGVGLAAQPEHDALRVRDFAGSAIWRRYEQWRAYEVALAQPSDETLHQARIAGKRLRYTLEFFADALGPNVEQVLAPLTALQENLGSLQDSVVARQRIHAFGLDEHAAIQSYLHTRDTEHAAHMAELPQRWEQVASAAYRQQLFELIVNL
jgi:CHAD domain-containing protein